MSNKTKMQILREATGKLAEAKRADDARAAQAHDLSTRNGIKVLPVSAAAPRAVVGRLPPEQVEKIKMQSAKRKGGKSKVVTVERKMSPVPDAVVDAVRGKKVRS